MALTSGILPNLLGGISQQPDILRHATQLTSQLNMTSSLVEGLSKRPPCEYWDFLGTTQLTSATQGFLHWIDRDPTERYVLILKDNATPLVYDLVNKNFETVNTPDGVGYLNISGAATSAFRAITVADFTFIVNTEKVAKKIETCTTPAEGVISFSGNVSDGDAVTISDGILEVTFAFDNNASVATGNVAVPIAGTTTGSRDNLLAAIQDSGLLITAEPVDLFVIDLTNDQMGIAGNVTITKVGANISVSGMHSGVGGRTSVRSDTGAAGAIVNVVVPQNGTNYAIFDEQFGAIASFNTADSGLLKSNDIATELETDIDAFGSSFSALKFGDSLFVRRLSSLTGATSGFTGKRMDLSVFSSNTPGGIIMADRQVQSFTDLPTFCKRFYIVQVTGDPGTPFDNYYVRSNIPGGAVPGADSIGDVVWEEVVAPGIQYKLDPTTMPHILVRESDGSFTFKQAEWLDRVCGDENTNPWPTFVDSPINDVFFFKNRLGFLSGENVILSEVGEYFNFFRSTATTLLDTDPIDVTVSTNQVANLFHAAQAGGRLFAFSSNLQFELVGDPLTPSSAALVNTTRYSARTDVRPVVGGDSIFFAFDRGSTFSGIREMIPKVNGEDETTDITSHVPKLIEGGIAAQTFSTIEQTLFVLPSTTGRKKVFVYKSHWEDRIEGREKVVSAWSLWQFPIDILSIRVIDEYLYLVMLDSDLDRLYVSRIDLRDGVTETGWDWRVLADMRVLSSDPDVTKVFSSPNTTFTMPYRWDVAQLPGGFPHVVVDMATGALVTTVSVNGTTGQFVIAGDQTAANLLFGLSYNAQAVFSTPVVRRNVGERSHPIPDGELYLLFWSINFTNSGRVRSRVTLPDGTQRSYTQVAAATATTGGLKSGQFKFPVRANTHQNLTIDVFNDRPYPSHFVNAGWEGNFILRSRNR